MEESSAKDLIKRRLIEDEAGHETSKFFYKDSLKDPKTGEWVNPYTGQPHSEEFLKNIPNTKDHFSPQAKQEMKNWKQQHGDSWNDFSSDRSLDLFELENGMYK